MNTIMASFRSTTARRLVVYIVLLGLLGLIAPLSLGVRAAPAAPAATMNLALGTYFGGSSDDEIYGVATDSSGIYLTGKTYSGNLPGAGGELQSSNDMFVAKLNPAGTQLLWTVLLGGSASEQGNALVSDGKGNLYVTGSTSSRDFPVTVGVEQTEFGGFSDVILLRLDAATGAVRWSTYFGGDNLDEGNGIALDGQGSVLVAGWWAQNDAVVLKFQTENGVGIWGRAWSNSSEAKANALVVAPDGTIWTTGKTDAIGTTSDFDIIGPALQTSCGAGSLSGDCGADAFVTQLSPDGDLIYSSLLGGSNNGSETASGGDEGLAIAVDAQGNLLVAGKTLATDFPTRNALQPEKRGADNFNDGFLTKISPDGSTMLYSTYLGGDKWDEVRSLVIDGQGNAIAGGYTGSQDFPLRDALQGTLGDGVCDLGGSERWCYDAFVTSVSPEGALNWSTYLGGGLDELGYGLAIDSGGIVLVGKTESFAHQGFPVSAGAFQPEKDFSDDGFVMRIGSASTQPPPGPPPGSYQVHLPFVMR